MSKLVLALIALSYASTSTASSASAAVPSFITYRNDGIVLVYFNSTRSGVVPACAIPTGSYFRFAINATTAAGKAQLAGILAAHASGEGVWVVGTGDCAVYADTESLQQFHTAG
jgi:hypothetical protein